MKDRRVVRRREHGLFERPTDLAGVDVERGDDLQVLHAVPADLGVLETDGIIRGCVMGGVGHAAQARDGCDEHQAAACALE